MIRNRRSGRARLLLVAGIARQPTAVSGTPCQSRHATIPRMPLQPERDEQSPGFFGRLKARLNRGGASIARDLRGLLRGRKIDAAVLEDLETRLLSADVGVEATQEILADLNRRVALRELDDVEALLNALRDRLTEMLAPCEQPLQIEPGAKPFVVLIVGVNGSGKTTSIGKLARELREQGRSVMLAAADTFRAAAIEQLHV